MNYLVVFAQTAHNNEHSSWTPSCSITHGSMSSSSLSCFSISSATFCNAMNAHTKPILSTSTDPSVQASWQISNVSPFSSRSDQENFQDEANWS